MPAELLVSVVGMKLAYLETVAQTSMTWWTSAVLFLATSLGAIWWKGREVEPRLVKWLGRLSALFIGSIIIYGLNLLWFLSAAESEVRALLSSNVQVATTAGLSVSTEYTLTFWAVVIGLSSFALLAVAWGFVIHHLLSTACKCQPPVPSGEQNAQSREGA